MKRPPVFFVLLAVVVAVFGSACGDTIRPVAATVNGADISQGALDDELKAIESNTAYVEALEQSGSTIRGQGTDTLDSAFVGRVLTRQIFLQLVHAEFVERKLEISAAEIREAESATADGVGGGQVFDKFPKSYRETLSRRSAEVTKLQASFGGADTSPAAIRAYYDANVAQFAQTCVSHVLFGVLGAGGQLDKAATEAQTDALRSSATDVRAKIAGGLDFAAAAQQFSVDVSNKASGGSLECGPAGRFVPEFEAAMALLQPNEVSPPVKTEFGWHLIKVTSRQPRTLEEATPEITSQLQSASEVGFSGFLQTALDKATITVNPRYGTFDKSGQSPGVVPPAPPGAIVPGPVLPEATPPTTP